MILFTMCVDAEYKQGMTYLQKKVVLILPAPLQGQAHHLVLLKNSLLHHMNVNNLLVHLVS